MTRINCGSFTGLILCFCVPSNSLTGLRRGNTSLATRTDAGAGGQAGQAGKPHAIPTSEPP